MDGSLQFGMLTRRSACLIFLFVSTLAFCQGARYENHPAMKARADGALVAASATIAICTQPANTSTQPCSPLATLYTDATLATPCTGTLKDGSVAGATNCSNPLVTDSKGNYHFYAASASYTIQTYGSGINTNVESDVPVFCGANSTCNLGTMTAKTLQGIQHCKDYATPGVTSFDAMMTACVAALPATGTGTANAMDVTDTTNLTMTANWAMSRSGTTILFPCGSISQGTNIITVPGGTNNVAWKGCAPFATIPLGTVNGTVFKYTGSATAHSFGDSSATSFGHLVEDIGCDMTSATGSAHCFDSTRVYGAELNRLRGACPVAANTITFLYINGTNTAPGGQSATLRENVESNCQFGYFITGSTSPPLSNGYQLIGGQFSGNAASGSIAIDVEAGNDIQFYGPFIGNYDTGLKVASPSNGATWGKIHMESCGTQGILFAVGSAASEIWTDTGCAITMNNTPNTVHLQGTYLQTPLMDTIRYRNLADTAMTFIFQGGLTVDKTEFIQWNDHAGNPKWTLGMDFNLGFDLRDAAGNNRFVATASGLSIEGPISSSTAININDVTNATTGGVQFWSGGGSPAVTASISGAGLIKGASYGSNTNCAVNSVSPAACGAAVAGAVVVPTTTTTYTINTSAVTAASRIFLQPISFASNLPSTPTCVVPTTPFITTISAISAATSFTFTLPSTTGQTCWQYWIVN